MLRIINVQSVLEQIHYPTWIQGSFTFSVIDNQCPWNNQIFTIDIKDGRAAVDAISNSSTTNNHIQLDFKCDIGSLSQLIAGYLSYDKLFESTEIMKYSDNRLPSKAFPEQLNVPRDFF